MDPFFAAYLDRLAALHGGIAAELDDLTVEALDWVPGRDMNSLAVLAAHAAGAEQHWIGEVAGGRPPSRVRQKEFAVRGRDAAALLALLDDSFAVAQEVLAALSPADLAAERVRPNGEITSAGWALLHALEHTAQHMGHIQIGRQLWDSAAARGR